MTLSLSLSLPRADKQQRSLSSVPYLHVSDFMLRRCHCFSETKCRLIISKLQVQDEGEKTLSFRRIWERAHPKNEIYTFAPVGKTSHVHAESTNRIGKGKRSGDSFFPICTIILHPSLLFAISSREIFVRKILSFKTRKGRCWDETQKRVKNFISYRRGEKKKNMWKSDRMIHFIRSLTSLIITRLFRSFVRFFWQNIVPILFSHWWLFTIRYSESNPVSLKFASSYYPQLLIYLHYYAHTSALSRRSESSTHTRAPEILLSELRELLTETTTAQWSGNLWILFGAFVPGRIAFWFMIEPWYDIGDTTTRRGIVEERRIERIWKGETRKRAYSQRSWKVVDVQSLLAVSHFDLWPFSRSSCVFEIERACRFFVSHPARKQHTKEMRRIVCLDDYPPTRRKIESLEEASERTRGKKLTARPAGDQCDTVMHEKSVL